MRLICPNCDAQYSVADDVVPEAGRDVQCSNCGHTWFEKRDTSALAEISDVMLAPKIDPNPTPPAPRPRELDPGVVDILREEAEFERTARRTDTNALETQTDLDLSQDPKPRDADKTRDQSTDSQADLDVSAAISAMVAAEADIPRRDRLPDVEEINSTLRQDSSQHPADSVDPKPRSKFRRGFMFAIVLFVIAAAVYVFAPRIITAAPQLDEPLTSYVNWVDGLRIAVDKQLQELLASTSDAATDATGN